MCSFCVSEDSNLMNREYNFQQSIFMFYVLMIIMYKVHVLSLYVTGPLESQMECFTLSMSFILIICLCIIYACNIWLPFDLHTYYKQTFNVILQWW
jgi:hypothetical protein